MKLIASVFILWVVLAGNIFAETSTSAKNPYVEERLSNEEKALYYKDPLKYMESLAIKRKNYDNEYSYRALELSLYYQGWAPEVVFFRFDKKINPILLAVPTKKEMVMDVKMRDKEKALRWARESIKNVHPSDLGLELCNLANLLYSKNSSKEDIEKFKNEYDTFYLYHFVDGPFCGSTLYGCGGVFAYSFYKGDMNFPIDLDACHNILIRSNHLLWRNFYSGFFAPKDKEFAKYILSLSTDYWDMQYLSDIYKGKYDPSDVNLEYAKYWQKKADDAKMSFVSFEMLAPNKGWEYLWRIERKKAKVKNPNISNREIFILFNKKYNIIKYGAKQKRVRHPYYALREDIVFEKVNSHYDRKHAEQIIQNILANECYIGIAIERYAYKAILNKYGVDQDLIEKLFKKANNGLFKCMSECDSYVPYGYEIFKKRMLNNF